MTEQSQDDYIDKRIIIITCTWCYLYHKSKKQHNIDIQHNIGFIHNGLQHFDYSLLSMVMNEIHLSI